MDWTLTGIARAVRGVYGRAVNKASLPTYNQDDPAPLAFDLATGRLLVDATGGDGGADTQYTSGTTLASPTGNAILAQFASSAPTLTNNELYVAQLDASGNLKVNVAAGGTSGQQYTGSPAVTVGTQIETLAGAYDGANVRPVKSDNTGTLFVNQGHLAGSTDTVSISDSTGANKATVSASGAVKVDNSGVTQPVSVASLPLPTGASTSAKQPALGTAGSASADVISVQGIASMTALKVDGSGVTQPVSGTVTANQGGAPWSANVTQFGGNAIVTGTGAGGNGIPRVTVSNDSIVGAVPTPSASVTATTVFQVSNLTNSSQTIKSSSGRIYYYHFYNPNVVDIYMNLYDVSGAVTVGTTAATRIIVVPALSVIDTPFVIGQSYANAIKTAATNVDGSTAPALNILATVDYI